MNTILKNRFGFLRCAAVSPEVVIGDIRKTAEGITEHIKHCAGKNVKLVVFPELCLAGGYTVGDLLHQKILQNEALEALLKICGASAEHSVLTIVGLPLCIGSSLYNVAAVIDRGDVVGIVPKTYLPSGGEFYEARWFANAHDLTIKEISLFGKTVPVGTDLLFEDHFDSTKILGIEICEDFWTAIPPSSYQAIAGATIIANLSASNELVGKTAYRRQLVSNQSGRCITGYIYASSGVGESTTDLVFGGHCMIAENGSILAESERLTGIPSITIADLDIDSCVHDRYRTTSFAKSSYELKGRPEFRRIKVSMKSNLPVKPERKIAASPFVPTNDADKAQVCADVFAIQSHGLAHRMKKTGLPKLILGVSGGLDSTLALLTCVKACRILGLEPKDQICAFTMPGFGTTEKTRTNAHILAEAAGVPIEQISIKDGAKRSLADINHNSDQDITYENAQARYRTFILMQKANQLGGIVVGTGDLSESALGWCTFNGDHMSHYNVNCSVPKTLVQFVVGWVADNDASPEMRKVLKDIILTPISPELTSTKQGEVTQKTEDIIGPYELHDFFLYHFIRRGASPSKVRYLALVAFGSQYDHATVTKWLKVFINRFFKSQFKRSTVPDGPKVGSVSLSPRGDWRMPSDAVATMWLQDLEESY